MNESLDHLPARTRRKLWAVVSLIREVAPMVEMIILFGSYARGDWVEDPVGGYYSDFDVVLIVKSPRVVEKYELWSKIEKRAERILGKTPLSLIVHDIGDVNEQLERGYYFFSDVKKEGILLYDSRRCELASAKPATEEQRAQYALESFQKWFTSASHFYGQFEHACEKGWTNIAAFELHQATERFYTAVLLVLTAYKAKSHNIEVLGKKCGDLHPAFRDVFPQGTPESDRLFKLLKAAYVDARYNPHYSITLEELSRLSERVRLLRDRTAEVCGERLAAMGVRTEV